MTRAFHLWYPAVLGAAIVAAILASGTAPALAQLARGAAIALGGMIGHPPGVAIYGGW